MPCWSSPHRASDINCAGAAAEPSVERTRKKLLDVGSSFQQFDEDVEASLFHRRALQERQLREAHGRLESIEIKIRAEMTQRADSDRSCQELVGHFLVEMQARLQHRTAERCEVLSANLGSLHQRCTTLERGVRQFRGELPSKLQVQTAALRRQLMELSLQFDGERRIVAKRDDQLLKVAEQAHFDVDAQTEQALGALEKRCESLQEFLDELAQEEEQRPQCEAHGRLLEKLALLRNEFHHAVAERSKADDSVMRAIGHYAELMHRSLKYPNY